MARRRAEAPALDAGVLLREPATVQRPRRRRHPADQPPRSRLRLERERPASPPLMQLRRASIFATSALSADVMLTDSRAVIIDEATLNMGRTAEVPLISRTVV